MNSLGIKMIAVVVLVCIAIGGIYFSVTSKQTPSAVETASNNTIPVSTKLEMYDYYGFKIDQPTLDHTPMVHGGLTFSGKMSKIPKQISMGLRLIVTGFPEGVDKPINSRTEVVPVIIDDGTGSFSQNVQLHFGAGEYHLRLEAPLDTSDTDDVQYKGVMEFKVLNEL